MARCISNKPELGDRVYRHCRPLQPGIITEINSPDFGGHFMCVHVQWLNGEKTAETTASLKSFDALVVETRKKLATHEATLMRLKTLENSIRRGC